MFATPRAAGQAGASTQVATGTSRFIVMYRGVRIGTETVTVARSGDGTLTIEANGQVGAPLDIYTAKFEMAYGTDWQPRRLLIDASLRNQALNVATTFGVTTAMNDVTQGSKRGSVSHQISARTIVLPPSYFGAYEALAARLPTMQPGTRFPIYVPPEGEISGTYTQSTPRRVITPQQSTELTEYEITLSRPGLPIQVLLWVDSRGRLAKVVFGEQGYLAIREDLGTVMARLERERNAGDADVFVPMSSFSVGATLTAPVKPAASNPAIVLVAPPGSQARDETRYGVSIFGQLAGRLSEAGFLVVRYDQRGVGQSGGRPEHAGIAEYSRDVSDVVAWLRKRKDVDARRIYLISHAEGAALALTAASRDQNIAGLALLSPSGLTGRETVLAQQQLELARTKGSDNDHATRVAIQQRLIEAVITGKGWEMVPPDMRRQSETMWFKDWLLFDPAVPIARVKQRILVLHGGLDREMPLPASERLQQLGSARKNLPPSATQRVVPPDVNHLLLVAKTGQPDEYDVLPSSRIAPHVITTLVTWLNQPPEKGK